MLGYVCWVGLFGGYVVMEWGPEIAVNGKRPDWLNGQQACLMKTSAWCTWQDETPAQPAEKWAWSHNGGLPCITAIKLPADHFAYTAIAKGFKPWGGGSEAPKDWDGEHTLTRDGDEKSAGYNWVHDGGFRNIIGYHPKRIAQPSPADTVTVSRITRNEADALIRQSDYDIFVVLSNFGIIRPDTKAEAIATKTGIALSDVEAVLTAVEEGE